jgi:MFS family permease
MHKEQDLMEAKNSLPIVGRDMGASGEDVNSAVTHDEKKDQFTSSTSSNVDLEGMSSEEAAEFEKKTLSRIDWRMLPLLGAMYAVCLIDRTNTGIARTAGMERDLGLKHGSRYSIILVVYFIPYILMQLPSNLMLRYLGVRTWIFFLVVAWGAAELGMGFVKSWQALAALRALLGLFEAGYFPAMAFVITTWYKRHEVQTRLSAFYLFSVFITGFSPIMAYGFTFLAGKGGLGGWSWIFIIEGIMTIVMGFMAYLYIPDFPDKNNFLTPQQTAFVLERIERDRGDSVPDEITREKVKKHLGDWTSWAYGLMFMSSTMPAYAITYFITTLLFGMGFNIRDSLLLSAPPFVYAALQAWVFAILSDRTKTRALWIIIQATITMIGLFITCYAPSNGARYAGLFLANAGACGCVPGVLAYAANNVVSQSKRAVSTAIIVAFGGIGGIFGSTVYRERDSPSYRPGLWATIACQILTITLCCILTVVYRRRNKEAREKGVILEGQEGFRYTI